MQVRTQTDRPMDRIVKMKQKISYTIISISLLILILASSADTSGKQSSGHKQWNKQLNEMNFIIMRTSAINIINGLLLTKGQAVRLKELCKSIETLSPPIPDMKGSADRDLTEIKKSFLKLTEYLIKQKQVPQKFKNRVTALRMKEAEIIKKSVIAAQKNSKSKTGCIKCHYPPSYFPKGDISKMKTESISKNKRYIIDLAHVQGLFGKRGTEKLWKIQSQVTDLLTSSQEYLLKDFQCCLFPPDSLKDSTNIGQAFVNDKWINYFREIRSYSVEDWERYKQLYITPLGDIIEATLPGIQKSEKNRILEKMELVLEESRKIDDVDFELQKESLCMKLRDEMNIDSKIRETKDEIEHRQFRAAMFLLLPGNSKIYDKLIKRLN